MGYGKQVIDFRIRRYTALLQQMFKIAQLVIYRFVALLLLRRHISQLGKNLTVGFLQGINVHLLFLAILTVTSDTEIGVDQQQ